MDSSDVPTFRHSDGTGVNRIVRSVYKDDSDLLTVRRSDNQRIETTEKVVVDAKEVCEPLYTDSWYSFPEDLQAWAPFDFRATRFHHLYYDTRFRPPFSCLENATNNEGIKYLFESGINDDPDNVEVIIALIDGGIRPDIWNGIPGNWGFEQGVWVNDDEIYNNFIDDDKNGYVDDSFGYDFYQDTPYDMRREDISGHGLEMTTVMVGGQGDSTERPTGVKEANTTTFGVCPTCKVMDLKIFGQGEDINKGIGIDRAAEAIYYAVDNNAKVILLALEAGGVLLPELYSNDRELSREFLAEYENYHYSEVFNEALAYAWSNDVVVVGSAGNKDFDNPTTLELAHYNSYTNHESVIQVGGTLTGIRSVMKSVSYPGHSIDIVAPGYFNIGPFTSLGTSQAAALVAGIVGMYRSVFPDKSAYEVKKTLLESAHDEVFSPGVEDLYYIEREQQIQQIPRFENENLFDFSLVNDPLGWDPYYGHGLLDMKDFFSGVKHRELVIDPETGRVGDYVQPTNVMIEDYDEDFQAWYQLVTAVEPSSASQILLYPNPVIQQLFIRSKGLRDVAFEIHDLTGKTVLRGVVDSSGIDVRKLKAGVYVMKVGEKRGRFLKK